MLRAAALIVILLMSLPAWAQTPEDAAANRLFVEAVQLWNRAEGEPLVERAATLQQVRLNLKTIIERHSGSSLAVRLVIGETVGPLSVGRVERAASESQGRVTAVSRAAGVGRVFRDCGDCPEMVVIPAGLSRLASSGLNVTIAAPFAVGKFEVTFAEWDACVAAGGCSHRPDDADWGRGRQPVMNVSWNDAQQYVAWLSRRSSKSYRLLSEDEWEYVAQADTGRNQQAKLGAEQANRETGKSYLETAPVGSFAPNAFGVHDMLGNVWEWTADCLNKSYLDMLMNRWREIHLNRGLAHNDVDHGHSAAASDGSARVTGDCSQRVLRGGASDFSANPKDADLENRIEMPAEERFVNFGFRVARPL